MSGAGIGYASIVYTDTYGAYDRASEAAMRTTLNLDDEIVRRARECSGIQEKTALVHTALRQLIAREAAKRLAALGGSMPGFQPGRRRRPGKTR